jgi:hypothetical protein
MKQRIFPLAFLEFSYFHFSVTLVNRVTYPNFMSRKANSPAQLFLSPSTMGLMTIFFCLRFETPQPGGPCPCRNTSPNRPSTVTSRRPAENNFLCCRLLPLPSNERYLPACTHRVFTSHRAATASCWLHSSCFEQIWHDNDIL